MEVNMTTKELKAIVKKVIAFVKVHWWWLGSLLCFLIAIHLRFPSVAQTVFGVLTILFLAFKLFYVGKGE